MSTTNMLSLDDGDTLLKAFWTELSLWSPGKFSTSRILGDNLLVSPEDDVDFFKVDLGVRDLLFIKLEAEYIGSELDATLRVFDASGNELAFSDNTQIKWFFSYDPYILYTAPSPGSYYVAVSSAVNYDYNPLVEDTGNGAGASTGEYTLHITVENTTFLSLEMAVAVAAAEDVKIPYNPVEVGGLSLGHFFDNGYYLSRNLDVAAAVDKGVFKTGFEHFVEYGWLEGRNGSALFNEKEYLATYADVAEAVTNQIWESGFEHFAFYGHREGRQPGSLFSLFSTYDYLRWHPDVELAVQQGKIGSAFEHYIEYGAREGRDCYVEKVPGAFSTFRASLSLFEEDFYLKYYTDVADVVRKGDFESGFQHFIMYGAAENRNPSTLFDSSAYLEANPDVANAVASGQSPSAFFHYAMHGAAEGRSLL